SDACWFSPDGKTLAVREAGGIALWDIDAAKRLRDLPGQLDFAFSPDGKTVATTEYTQEHKGIIRVWEVAAGTNRVLANLPSYARAIAFSPAGNRLYRAVDNQSLRAWDITTGKELWKNDHPAAKLAVSADGKWLCTDTYLEGPLALWDADTGQRIAAFKSEERFWTMQIAISPDGKWI